VVLRLPEEWEQSCQYSVLGADEDSVAIVLYGKSQVPKIQHIHFDKSHYWICLGNSGNREFFRKVSGKG